MDIREEVVKLKKDGIEKQEIPTEEYKRAEIFVKNVAKTSDGQQERYQKIMEGLGLFTKYIDRDIFSEEAIETMGKALWASGGCSSKEQFIADAMKALEPVFELVDNHLEEFEDAMTKAMNKKGRFIEVNRALSYGRDGGNLHLHVSYGRSIKNKVGLYLGGIKEIAKIVRGNPKVHSITAKSWLVARNESLFEKFGFKIESVNGNEGSGISNDEREIKLASINREDFLTRY